MNRTTRARVTLLSIWFGGFALNLGILLYLYARGWMHPSNLRLAAAQLNELYAPFLGAITLYYWGSRQPEAPAVLGTGTTSFALATLLSFGWNGLLLAFLIPLAFGSGTIEESLENVRGIVGIFSWLAAGAMGYYFARPTQGATG